MASECCDVIDFSIFMKFWNILKRNYSDTKHNDKDAKVYFHCFEKVKKEDFSKAITKVLKYSSYFPRIDEIQRFLSYGENLFNYTPITDEDQKILDFDWINYKESGGEK